ncbi:unnamed protein product [Rotaria sp. Silwood1]|nr:unnamed protein product [Rotaria sp. Silwood1]CAF3607156.1 unnamed protein product [Rotaria sp. Silwood1]CAF3653918.1 unnamed protein product [Rotaria sp. Silwood1]CAF4770211.1 unnamed protein product [Rotaria sp. Silwood1]CAF4858965.1 unnamed protein product [Rotaria sp. Silwood1]
MRRGTIINSWQDLHTMTSSCLNQSVGFDNEPFNSSKQNQQQTKATAYYETDHSSVPCRSLSPPISSLNNNHERAKSADHSQMSLNATMPMAPSSSSTYTDPLNNSAKTTSRMSRSVNARNNSTVDNHSNTIYIDKLHETQQECEKQELNLLNKRFGNYLDKIKHLANINANLRRQVDNAYRKYMGQYEEQDIEIKNDNKIIIKKYQHPYEIQLNNLRKNINNEVHAQTLVQIRLQRADYDIKFYLNNIKLLTLHEQKQAEQIRKIRQQLEINLQELEQLKQQCENREQDLQMYKNQYDEYINKLINFSNDYDKITYERMENENNLSTLKEQISFEQEYYHRRQQEFEYLEKFHYNLNKEFNKNEFHYIVQQIRKDYQELNDIRLSELETLYKTKLDTIRNEIIKHDEQKEQPKQDEIRLVLDSTKQEYRKLIEQNQLLKDKLEHLEHNLHTIIEQNHQHYEISDREYKKLHIDLSELDCIIVHLRENTVNLWSEINTYRYLLLNLLTPTNDKKTHQQYQKSSRSFSSPPTSIKKIISTEKSNTSTITTEHNIQEIKNSISTKTKSYPQQYRDETTGFIVHIEDGIIWVRI